MIILIPMAGLATRFAHEGITTPKPLIKVAGKTLIEHTVSTLGLKGTYVFVTREYPNKEDNVALSAELERLCPGHLEERLDQPTRGAVETCWMARTWIEDDEELVITNCDQRMEWDSDQFMTAITGFGTDGLVVTHESKDPKHSYAEIPIDNLVNRIVEKEVISNDALVGIHYWRRGRDFVASAQALMGEVATGATTREPYISETYNHLIAAGKRVVVHRIGPNEYIPLGTPYDVAIYEAKVKEYNTEKPTSLFIDLDGTILQHVHRFSEIENTVPLLLDGVRSKLDEWDSHGHRIIFCTARKESARQLTEQQLRFLGIAYDQLIMGLTSGPRVLVNDKLTEAAPNRAVAVNVLTNKGLATVEWKEMGL